MKNNKLKKLLVGGACACMLLTGGLTLSGCSLSNEQEKAMNYIVAQVEKEEAVEMIAKSRLNFIMSNFNNLEMSANMNMYQGFEDVLLHNSGFKNYYRTGEYSKIYGSIEDGKVVGITKSDFKNDYHYTYSNYESEEFDEIDYYSGMWAMHSADIFSQTPVNEIGEITTEHIYNIKAIEGGYELEIVANLSSIIETDLSKYEEDAQAQIYNIVMKIEIKNDFITKVNFKGVQIQVPVNDLKQITTQDGSTIILDEKGMPTISTYYNSEVMTMTMDVEYKYENINFSDFDTKVAEIEERFIIQE